MTEQERRRAMTEVEKVARAMCKAGGYDPDEMMPNDGPRWRYYVPGAEAAIAALDAARGESADERQAMMRQAAKDRAAFDKLGDREDEARETLADMREAMCSEPARDRIAKALELLEACDGESAGQELLALRAELAAVKASEARLREAFLETREMLGLVEPIVCDECCPTKWVTAEGQPHCKLHEDVRAVLFKHEAIRDEARAALQESK